jgi:hypothetical protein
MFFRKALEQEAFRNTRRHKLIRNQGQTTIMLFRDAMEGKRIKINLIK